ncbi:MAG: hypothetical protein IPH28_06730 [Cytophagaceae bacterium]|nr:hypothetical protein [Cytophagaceae bacterium]
MANQPVLSKENTLELIPIIEKSLKPVPLNGLILVGANRNEWVKARQICVILTIFPKRITYLK